MRESGGKNFAGIIGIIASVGMAALSLIYQIVNNGNHDDGAKWSAQAERDRAQDDDRAHIREDVAEMKGRLQK